MMTLRIRSLVALLVAAATVTACHKKPAEVTPTPQTPPPAPTRTDTQRPAPPPPTRPVDNSAADAAAMAAAIAAVKNTLTEPVYFEYDMADLRPEAIAALDRKVTHLQQNPAVRLRIEGHTDERGSNEYNMALGQRRAAVSMKYLTDRGINASRFDVVSFGEERPAMMGEGEASWSKNRRDEFQIVAGADQIRPAGR